MGRLNNPYLACFILQPTATPRPHINGFLWASLKACRLAALKSSKPSQQAPQGHTSMASYGRPSLPDLPALKPLKPSQQPLQGHTSKTSYGPLKQSLTWHASSCSQQPPQGHTSMASYGPLKQSLWHASSCSQQAPQGHTSMASYGRPSLPLASP